jgi:hypothetical protein
MDVFQKKGYQIGKSFISHNINILMNPVGLYSALGWMMTLSYGNVFLYFLLAFFCCIFYHFQSVGSAEEFLKEDAQLRYPDMS